MKKTKHAPDWQFFEEILQEVTTAARYAEMKRFYSHSDITVHDHCIAVATRAFEKASRHPHRYDMRALVRGALLHDYYLYDWHDPNKGFRWHGFKHHRFALENAMRDFELSKKEQNIIYSHMFPLTFWCLPRCREAITVTLADKRVAFDETMKKYRDKRAHRSANRGKDKNEQ